VPHDLVRLFACEVAPREERSVVVRRAVQYHLEQARSLEDLLKPPLSKLDPELAQAARAQLERERAAGRALVDQAARAGLDLTAGLVGELIGLLQLPVPPDGPRPIADDPPDNVSGILRGSGFGAKEWVDVFCAGHGVGSGETDGAGRFAIPVSLGRQPRGTVLLIQAVGRRTDGEGGFYRFTV
jgi:hypothetical protein